MPLSCPYSVTTGNPIGFPSPPINPPDPGPEGEPGVSPIPDDVYEGQPFSFTATYQCYTLSGESEVTPVSTQIQLVSYSGAASGVLCEQLNSTTLKISGNASGVFTDAYYKFLMQDNSIKFLPANTTEKYKALIEWSIPENKIVTVSYSVTVNITNLEDGTSEQVTNSFSHEVYWKLEPALAQFRALLSRGTV